MAGRDRRELIDQKDGWTKKSWVRGSGWLAFLFLVECVGAESHMSQSAVNEGRVIVTSRTL